MTLDQLRSMSIAESRIQMDWPARYRTRGRQHHESPARPLRDLPGFTDCDAHPAVMADPFGGNVNKTMIRTAGVKKSYKLGRDNHVDALRGASIEIEAGEMVAIVGPSGSGKSTVMHLIGCLDTPDAGKVYIDGKRVDDLKGGALTRLRGTEIGFVFQGFNLIPTLNAIDNVALAAEYAGTPRSQALARAEELLELVGLGARKRHLPSELSGGQQQRVAIARALVNRPKIVLGDEPTGDLDTATSDEIVGVLRDINLTTGTTFVIVTHNPEVAAACDRTIRMRDGAVEDHGLDDCCVNMDQVREAHDARVAAGAAISATA